MKSIFSLGAAARPPRPARVFQRSSRAFTRNYTTSPAALGPASSTGACSHRTCSALLNRLHQQHLRLLHSVCPSSTGTVLLPLPMLLLLHPVLLPPSLPRLLIILTLRGGATLSLASSEAPNSTAQPRTSVFPQKELPSVARFSNKLLPLLLTHEDKRWLIVLFKTQKEKVYCHCTYI